MRTVSIQVNDPAVELDGSTFINFADPAVVVTEDSQTGIQQISIPVGSGFGAFDPGEFLDGPPSDYWLKHMSVSRPNGEPFSPGSFFGIKAPVGTIATPVPGLAMPWLEFVAQADTDNGMLSEGICSIIPPDHLLTFDTTQGGDLGPFVIQFSLERVPRIQQTCQRPIVEPDFSLVQPE